MIDYRGVRDLKLTKPSPVATKAGPPPWGPELEKQLLRPRERTPLVPLQHSHQYWMEMLAHLPIGSLEQVLGEAASLLPSSSSSLEHQKHLVAHPLLFLVHFPCPS